MEFLRDAAHVISLDDFFSRRVSADRLNVALTFDDGYKSWVTTVMPVLQALSMPAAFFVSSGFVGLSRDEEARFFQASARSARATTGTLSHADLNTLVAEGFTIGGHTATHCNLARIRNESVLADEVEGDKARMETLIHRRLDYFAYPMGAHRNPWFDLAGVLQRAGYRGALTTMPGPNMISTNPFFLRREVVSASMANPVFQARAMGCADPSSFLRAWLLLRFRKNGQP
jgi:peptidoglycan/xylan/chitin deacetylase (PgdA/CDA1 family)